MQYPKDPLTEAVRQMLEETDSIVPFADEVSRLFGWRFQGENEAANRCRQYFNGHAYRHLPAAAILTAVRVSGLDLVSPLIQREALRAELEMETPDRPGIASVRTERRLRSAG